MAKLVTRPEKRAARHRRVRRRVHGTTERPRLSVFRSLRHIYVQVIDDETGHTLAAASSKEPDVAALAGGPGKRQVARVVGTTVARRAIEVGVTRSVLDRGGYKYHGRVKALADGAREGGLDF
jgi:large subunit ribosomal protein L18